MGSKILWAAARFRPSDKWRLHPETGRVLFRIADEASVTEEVWGRVHPLCKVPGEILLRYGLATFCEFMDGGVAAGHFEREDHPDGGVTYRWPLVFSAEKAT